MEIPAPWKPFTPWSLAVTAKISVFNDIRRFREVVLMVSCTAGPVILSTGLYKVLQAHYLIAIESFVSSISTNTRAWSPIFRRCIIEVEIAVLENSNDVACRYSCSSLKWPSGKKLNVSWPTHDGELLSNNDKLDFCRPPCKLRFFRFNHLLLSCADVLSRSSII